MRRLLLYPFRYRSEVTGKWAKARYVAEMHEIERRHAPGTWEIIGPPEIRDVDPDARYFNPHRLTAAAELAWRSEAQPQINPHLDQPPAIDALERFLVALFLRRYVTYCARKRCFSHMEGAAALLREVAAR
ncbi:MAG TPA: hypothetical protein VJ891_04945 [Casimicrobiaceae bacterium]|nr:hypothetical protein [Casimicrobiaceae bacterium]